MKKAKQREISTFFKKAEKNGPVTPSRKRTRSPEVSDNRPPKVSAAKLREGIRRSSEREKENRRQVDDLFRDSTASKVLEDTVLEEDTSTCLFDDDSLLEKTTNKDEKIDDGFDDDIDFDELVLAQSSNRKISSNTFVGRGRVVEKLGDDVVIVEDGTGENFRLNVDPKWYLHEDDVVHGPPEFGSVVIAHSDNLISCTNVATAAKCPREAVLGERFRDSEYGTRGSIRMLIGTILHELFQGLLTDTIDGRVLSVQKISTQFRKIAENFIEDIMLAGGTIEEVTKESESYFPVIYSLLKNLIQVGLETKLAFASPENPNRTNFEDSVIKIVAVPDIEENLWEPRLGIKGKIDVTAKVKAKGRTNRLTVPIELKSGRGDNLIMEHRIQTQMYGAVHAIRGGQSFDQMTGLVCYIKTGKVFSVPVKRNEFDSVMENRNIVASYLRRPLTKTKEEVRKLPPLISDSRKCEFCFKRQLCSFWSKQEELLHDDPVVQKKFDEDNASVSPEIIQYVSKWTRLGLLEQKNINKRARGNEVWNTSDAKTCLTGLESHSAPVRRGTRWNGLFKLPYNTDWPFDQGQSVYISCGEQYAVASGYVLRTTPNKGVTGRALVELSLSRNLSNRKDYRVNLMKGAGGGNFDTTQWLGNIMLYASPYGKALRDNLINPPSFHKTVKVGFPAMYDGGRNLLKQTLQGSLNVFQKRALKLALETINYSLIQGFPGSGKTFLIVELVRVLLSFGQRILITSHMHSAVDNILIRLLPKLSKDQINSTLRIGSDKKIDIAVHHVSEETRLSNCTTSEDYQKIYKNARIIAGTCMGVARHGVFTGGLVDFAIVDEAGQVSEPIVLGAIIHSKKFILVGDPCQLPPLIHSRSAKAQGAQISLMERLSEEHPGALRQLQTQYRFNDHITDLANHLAYKGKMMSAEANKDQNLLSFYQNWKVTESDEWLKAAVDPSSSITFIDTSEKSGLEQKVEGRGYTNEMETKIIANLVKKLNVMQVKKDCIGIIAPYRAQIELLRERLSHEEGVEIDTVDKFQGRENKIIIISFVRSVADLDIDQVNSELLESVNRINVACTRAQYKLIFVGCCKTINKIPITRKLVTYLNENKCVSVLPFAQFPV